MKTGGLGDESVSTGEGRKRGREAVRGEREEGMMRSRGPGLSSASPSAHPPPFLALSGTVSSAFGGVMSEYQEVRADRSGARNRNRNDRSVFDDWR